MKILIIEDDDIYANALEMMIVQMGYQVAGVANNATEALRLFKATHPNLVLMDIHLKGGDNGIEIAQQIYNVPVIFITAMQEDQVFEQAIETNPFAYINKPIDQIALQRSIKLAIHKYHHSDELSDGISLHLKVGRQIQKILITSILYLKVEQKQVIIMLKDQQIKVRMSLGKLANLLPQNNFIQVHQSYAINTQKIDKIDKTFVRIGTDNIPVSRRHRKKLLKTIKQVK